MSFHHHSLQAYDYDCIGCDVWCTLNQPHQKDLARFHEKRGREWMVNPIVWPPPALKGKPTMVRHCLIGGFWWLVFMEVIELDFRASLQLDLPNHGPLCLLNSRCNLLCESCMFLLVWIGKMEPQAPQVICGTPGSLGNCGTQAPQVIVAPNNYWSQHSWAFNVWACGSCWWVDVTTTSKYHEMKICAMVYMFCLGLSVISFNSCLQCWRCCLSF